MPVDVHILAQRGIVYVRYSGHITLSESRDAFHGYLAHPDCRPGQRHLVDLGRITSAEQDHLGMMQLQADKATLLKSLGVETFMVFLAPTPELRALAHHFLRAWDGIEHIVGRILTDEEHALQVLGQPETSIAEMLAVTAGN